MGCLLGILGTALAIVVLYLLFSFIDIIVGFVGSLLSSTGQEIALIVIAIIVLVGMNVLAYCASFVWGQRKPWFFFLGLGLTILFCTMPFWAV